MSGYKVFTRYSDRCYYKSVGGFTLIWDVTMLLHSIMDMIK